MRRALCPCGCGKVTRGRYASGHGPLVPSNYRHRNGKRLHVFRAEAALGKPLPPGAVVHHADGSKADDAPLVICENQGYHMLLHERMRIKQAGGNPNTDAVCSLCRLVKPREAFGKKRERVWLGINQACRVCANGRSKALRVRQRITAMRAEGRD